jgi:hypothetical protein
MVAGCAGEIWMAGEAAGTTEETVTPVTSTTEAATGAAPDALISTDGEVVNLEDFKETLKKEAWNVVIDAMAQRLMADYAEAWEAAYQEQQEKTTLEAETRPREEETGGPPKEVKSRKRPQAADYFEETII